MSLITIFELIWRTDAIAVCAASIALLCRLCIMQPIAQSAKVCSGCRRVARGSDEGHGNVTLRLVAIGGKQ